MPAEKPALSAPARVLCASMLPHIVDSVIDHAPNASLLALRVNKEFRALADSHLAYHITVVKPRLAHYSRMDAYDVTSARGPIGRIKYTPEMQQTIAGSFLRSARVVDIVVNRKWSSMVYTLVRCCRGAAFRFRAWTDLRGLPFRNATVVLFGEDAPPTVRGYLKYGLKGLSGVDTLVVHIRGPGPSTRCTLLNVRHLVLVVHPWALSLALLEQLEKEGGDWNSDVHHFRQVRELIDNQIGVLWDFLWTGYIWRIPTTVVGLDFSTPDRAADIELARHLQGWLVSDGRDAGIPDPPVMPRFLDVAEYQREVGNETFQVHVNSKWVQRPAGTVVTGEQS